MVQQVSSPAEAELVALVSELLRELGGTAEHVSLRSALDRDLGLGSLERVELLMRVERKFGRRLPDDTAQRAETLGEWLIALEAGADAAEYARKRYDVRQPGPAPEAPASATSFAQVLRGFADSHPERVQIHLFEDDRGLDITYGELCQRSVSVARGLISRGLKPGETVAIMLPTGADFFYSFFGVMLAGGIAAPIYPPARPKQIEEYVRRQLKILNNARARFLISWERAKLVSDVMRAGLENLAAVASVADLEAEGRLSRAPLPEPSEIFFLQYTSGSTGNPKGVTLTHSNVLANVRGIGWAVQARPDDAVVSWLPLYHDMGLIGSWLFSVYHAFPITVMSPLDFLSRPERWLWALSDSGGTLCPAPNFSYELCVRKIEDAALEGVDLSRWRVAINAGEPVLPATLRSFAERFGPWGFRAESYVPCYGLAESSVALTFPRIDRKPVVDVIDRAVYEAKGEARPPASEDARKLEFVANGRALPGHEVKIVDEEGRSAPERSRGRVLFRGPSMTQGYFENPEATNAVIDADGWMDSGDLGYFADSEIYITGRVKDCIIKSGHNIIPQDVEAAAAEVEGVRKGCIAAFGSVDPTTGTEKLVAVVETRVLDEAERRSIVEGVTASVAEKVGTPPDHVVLVAPNTVPKTSSGKIRRTETRRMYEQDELAAAQQSEPWVQMLRLWMSNLRGWLSVKAGEMGGVGRRMYQGATLALAAGLIGMPSRLIPNRSLQAAAARAALRATAALNDATAEVHGDTPTRGGVVVATRSGAGDAAALIAGLAGPLLIAGDRAIADAPSLVQFLLEPLLIEGEEVSEMLERGFGVVALADSPGGEPHERSRFRLEPLEAAQRAGAGIVPVAVEAAEVFPLRGSATLRVRGAVVAESEPRRTRRALKSVLVGRST